MTPACCELVELKSAISWWPGSPVETELLKKFWSDRVTEDVSAGSLKPCGRILSSLIPFKSFYSLFLFPDVVGLVVPFVLWVGKKLR